METKVVVPSEGQKITLDANGKLMVPSHPIIPFIEGDGIGVDVTPAMIKVVDAAVAKAYQELERDGIIRTIPGKGTYICATLPETKDTVRLQQVESALHSQLLELKMMGISREEACALIGRMYDELSV